MKRFVTFSLMAMLILAISCSKSNSVEDKGKGKGKVYYKILAIGNDTTTSPILMSTMAVNNIQVDNNGNSGNDHETYNEDNYLKLRILGWDGTKYLIEITNKQNCQVDVELNYENIPITAISPNRKNNINHTWVAANATEVFELKGSPALGKIKVKALTICNWQGTPKWVKADITATILPIKFTSHKVDNLPDGRTKISFSVAETDGTEKFLIMRSYDSRDFTLAETIKYNPSVKDYICILKPEKS